MAASRRLAAMATIVATLLSRASAASAEELTIGPHTESEMIGEVLAVMQAVAKDGMTMLVVTREIGFAREVADSIVFMADGSIVAAGPPSQLLGARQTRAPGPSLIVSCSGQFFTAPAVSPPTSRRCTARNSTRVGIMVSVVAAIIGPHCAFSPPTKLYRPTVITCFSPEPRMMKP